MSITLSFYNNKGGVSKTSSVANVSACLHAKGYKVLMIDFDPQANLSQHFGHEDAKETLFEVFLENANILTRIKTVLPGLHLIPSNDSLYFLDYHLHDLPRGEFMLKKHIHSFLHQNYDFILIDCHSFLNFLTINALAAADYNLIPCSTDCLSINGLWQLNEMLEEVKEEMRLDFQVAGIFLTQAEKESNLYQAASTLLERNFPEYYLHADISRDIHVSCAPIYAIDIFRYQPECAGATDYQLLCDRILERINRPLVSNG
jgi:chromosome partitioning protein